MKTNTLSRISEHLAAELERFNLLFKTGLKSKTALVNLITKYILRQKGKKIRPILVLLSAKISGGVTERTYRGAILVELLHTATLVHDDVVDNADTRRGFPSINAIWKEKIAVLLGDYLLAQGLMKAVEGEDFDFLRVTTDTVRRMSEGELLQISKTRKLDTDEETYFRIISDKTASLLSTCCEIGARSASGDSEKIAAMREFGENLGIAFQIQDDILDYTGTNLIIGKPAGGDIKEKKITLPLLHALKQVDKKRSTEIIKIIRKGAKRDGVKNIIAFVNENQGIEYARKIAEQYINKAKNNLSVFPESETKKYMLELLDFIVNRNK